MVAHQTVGQKLEAELVAIKGEPLQVLRSVRIVAEDRLALVAADNHMVEPAGNLESLRTRHRGTIIAQWETDPIDTIDTLHPLAQGVLVDLQPRAQKNRAQTLQTIGRTRLHASR